MIVIMSLKLDSYYQLKISAQFIEQKYIFVIYLKRSRANKN